MNWFSHRDCVLDLECILNPLIVLVFVSDSDGKTNTFGAYSLTANRDVWELTAYVKIDSSDQGKISATILIDAVEPDVKMTKALTQNKNDK